MSRSEKVFKYPFKLKDSPLPTILINSKKHCPTPGLQVKEVKLRIGNLKYIYIRYLDFKNCSIAYNNQPPSNYLLCSYLYLTTIFHRDTTMDAYIHVHAYLLHKSFQFLLELLLLMYLLPPYIPTGMDLMPGLSLYDSVLFLK